MLLFWALAEAKHGQDRKNKLLHCCHHLAIECKRKTCWLCRNTFETDAVVVVLLWWEEKEGLDKDDVLLLLVVVLLCVIIIHKNRQKKRK